MKHVKNIAILSIYNLEEMTQDGKDMIISWLREHAKDIKNSGDIFGDKEHGFSVSRFSNNEIFHRKDSP